MSYVVRCWNRQLCYTSLGVGADSYHTSLGVEADSCVIRHYVLEKATVSYVVKCWNRQPCHTSLGVGEDSCVIRHRCWNRQLCHTP